MAATLVLAFNTNRCYTAQGQRISIWRLEVGDKVFITLVDLDRHLQYHLPPIDEDSRTYLTPHIVMRMYDSGNVIQTTSATHEAVRELINRAHNLSYPKEMYP